MKIFVKGIAIVMAVTLTSCTNGKGKYSKASKYVELHKTEDRTIINDEKQTSFSNVDTAGNDSSILTYQSGSPAANIDWDKKMIKTADVTIELKDFKNFNSVIHNSLKQYGAYIAAEQQNQADGKVEDVVVIKVPVDKFEDLLNILPAESAKVLQKRISTEDVANEMVDTRARIEAKKQARDQYLSLLKKAKTMKEIVEVQKEINSIQQDIEAGSGRVQYLAHEAAYSTVNLTYFQYITPSADNDNSSTFVVKLKEAFYDGAAVVSGLLLVMVTLWPLLFASIIIFFIVKKYRSNMKLVKK